MVRFSLHVFHSLVQPSAGTGLANSKYNFKHYGFSFSAENISFFANGYLMWCKLLWHGSILNGTPRLIRMFYA